MSLLIKFKLNDSTIPGTLYADLSDGKNQTTNLKHKNVVQLRIGEVVYYFSF